MPEFDRHCFRLACLVQQGISRLQTSEAPCATFGRYDLERCQDLFRKLEKARSHKLDLAAAAVARDLDDALYRLKEQLTSHLALLAGRSEVRAVPSLNSLYGEVLGLSEEFDTTHYDLKQRLIVVTTEPIELEDVYLGKFEIRLSLDELGEHRPYEVVAVNANPAAADEGITHPHVRDNHLCEGDAVISIRQALAGGRLADFFQIVNQVLHGYNAGSAYAELNTWSGISCADCGEALGDDDACTCQQCETRVCDRCTWVCQSCCSNFCSECSYACEQCHRRFCEACLHSCAKCEEQFCQSCLSNGKCRDCHDYDASKDESGDGETAEPATAPPAASEADIAVQPASLGQAPVPA